MTGPSPRHSAGAACDSRRGLTLVFGGLGPDGFLGDTWAWDGRQWTRLAETGPEARALTQMAYDKARDRVVLFGGRKGWPDGDLSDTWEWDGSTWLRVPGPVLSRTMIKEKARSPPTSSDCLCSLPQ